MVTEKVGIFGGTFDPVHNGHLITTRFVKEMRNLDKVILIPNHISPLKLDYSPTPSEKRLKMLQLAISGMDGFVTDDFEINNEEVSYTLKTLEHFRKTYSGIELIIGFDNYLCFDKWYEFKHILDICNVVVMKRSDNSGQAEHPLVREKAVLLDTPSIDISATEIRNRIKSGLSVKHLIPESVEDYIHKYGLYSDDYYRKGTEV